jgi:hypothetical protein
MSSKMRSKVDDDVFFSSVVKNALNEEEQSLDMGIRSKLTQMRFNAIDNALPQQQLLNKGIFQWGMSLALTAMFAVLLMVNFNAFNTTDTSKVIARGDSAPVEELFAEDTDETLEMYEWFYKNYG